ncbi:hypothetical protein J1777_07095 [Comamonas denitrificans]|uniref:Uncharacterized protein n=1 Tax=Comamonas denitrificans TaxID=117506 RepID=A0A939H0Y7_9BURK|nr:hypothetical protein [Comamonas denitrificans]MBO1249596.1 hypothetical protein [Comamonas denitrificans]
MLLEQVLLVAAGCLASVGGCGMGCLLRTDELSGAVQKALAVFNKNGLKPLISKRRQLLFLKTKTAQTPKKAAKPGAYSPTSPG